MKEMIRKLRNIAALLFTSLICFTACSEDKFEDSIYTITEEKLDSVGVWVKENYTNPYNIEVLYRWDDSESDLSLNLVPPRLVNVKPFLRMVMQTWIQPYLTILGEDVMNPIFPKQILLLGSGGLNEDGTQTLGTAEGGKKMVLFAVDDFKHDDKASVKYYVRIMHHEFAHILNQKKDYPTSYKKITPKNYTVSWHNVSEANALNFGFITPYSMSEPDEDFVEMLANYVINTQEEWDAIIGKANADGQTLINRKLDVVRTYLEESWHLDLNVLRSEVLEALEEVYAGVF